MAPDNKMTLEQISGFKDIIIKRSTTELEQIQTAIQEVLTVRKEIKEKT